MKTPVVAALLAAGLVAGCATQPKLDYREYAGQPIKSFYMTNYDGWAPVSDNQLVVWTGINEAYLIQVAGYCPDLKFAHVVAVTSTASNVDKFEKVIVGRDRCFINEIRPIDTKQMKADRKLMREQMRKPAADPVS